MELGAERKGVHVKPLGVLGLRRLGATEWAEGEVHLARRRRHRRRRPSPPPPVRRPVVLPAAAVVPDMFFSVVSGGAALAVLRRGAGLWRLGGRGGRGGFGTSRSTSSPEKKGAWPELMASTPR